MGEGRYRTLLCLIQLAVAGAGRRRTKRSSVLDPLAEGFDGTLARRAARRSGGRDRRARRPPGHRARCAGVLGTEVTNVFDTQVAAGFAGLGAQSSYESLLNELLGVRVQKSASFTRWDARPLSRRAARLRTRGRRAPARARRRARAPAGQARPAGVGARGVRAARALQRRARPRRDLRASAARPQPERLSASRSRASSWSGASRRPRARTGRCRACSATPRWWRSPSASPSSAPSSSRSAASARRRCAARRGAARGGRARARAPPSRPGEERAAGAAEPDDAPLIALAEALLRARAREAGLAYELLAARADLQAIVAARRDGDDRRTCARCAAGAASSSATELLELLDGRAVAVRTERRDAASRPTP